MLTHIWSCIHIVLTNIPPTFVFPSVWLVFRQSFCPAIHYLSTFGIYCPWNTLFAFLLLCVFSTYFSVMTTLKRRKLAFFHYTIKRILFFFLIHNCWFSSFRFHLVQLIFHLLFSDFFWFCADLLFIAQLVLAPFIYSAN